MNIPKKLAVPALAAAGVAGIAALAKAAAVKMEEKSLDGIELSLRQTCTGHDGESVGDVMFVDPGDTICYVLSLKNGTNQVLDGTLVLQSPALEFGEVTESGSGSQAAEDLVSFDVDGLEPGCAVHKLVTVELPEDGSLTGWYASAWFDMPRGRHGWAVCTDSVQAELDV